MRGRAAAKAKAKARTEGMANRTTRKRMRAVHTVNRRTERSAQESRTARTRVIAGTSEPAMIASTGVIEAIGATPFLSIFTSTTSNGATCANRSDERRVGKESDSKCQSRWLPYHINKKTKK